MVEPIVPVLGVQGNESLIYHWIFNLAVFDVVRKKLLDINLVNEVRSLLLEFSLMIREPYLDGKTLEYEQMVKVVSLSYLTGTERARLDDLQTS